MAHETNIETQMMILRRFKIEEILRIGLRDLLEKSTLQEFFEELSALADLAAETAFSAVMAQFKNKPRLAVIGMGKFGGAELSYSSDLDFIFISDEATSSSANEAVIKIIDFLSRNTSEGFVFRTDARLRPYGEKSVLAPTLQSYQDYFHKNICTWEKQALTKARFICGDEDLGRSFFKLRDELIYSSPLSEKEKEEILHMRERIKKERNKAKNKQREIKMSAGGILDIEFAVQYLLLKQGSSHPELRVPGTLPALHALAHTKVLSQETVTVLEQGYSFLRALENKLRIVKDLALDTLPEDPAELEHCARRMGYQDHNDQTAAQKLNEEYLAQTHRIRENYLHVFSVTT